MTCSPTGQTATLGLDDSKEGVDLLSDNTMDGLDVPPELPGEASLDPPQPPDAATPQLAMQPSAAMLYSQPRSVFPGENATQHGTGWPTIVHTCDAKVTLPTRLKSNASRTVLHPPSHAVRMG